MSSALCCVNLSNAFQNDAKPKILVCSSAVFKRCKSISPPKEAQTNRVFFIAQHVAGGNNIRQQQQQQKQLKHTRHLTRQVIEFLAQICMRPQWR